MKSRYGSWQVLWAGWLLLALGWPFSAQAIPAFARQYQASCALCHAAYPRLNAFGKQFQADNLRMANWRATTVDTGDEQLALPAVPPLAIRAQAYVQGRTAESIDPVTGESRHAGTDLQGPYLIKLLSSAPLSEHMSYYFYGIFAEKGGNGELVVEDAWFSYDDLWGSGVGLTLGQFQIGGLMFERETRLTFQDFIAYRMAGITYDRGLLLSRDVGPVGVVLGLTNGNGIEENFGIDSPGYRRPDRMFDNDSDKTAFGRLGLSLGPVEVGVFGLAGRQRSVAPDNAGLDEGLREVDKRILGVDVSGRLGRGLYWFAQYLWNDWGRFLDADPERNYRWQGGFAGVDYVTAGDNVYSLLYNYADAGDFAGSDTVYEGIDINVLTLTASHYFMRNLKGIVEVDIDFQDEHDRRGDFYTGHLTKEHALLVGFDAAF